MKYVFARMDNGQFMAMPASLMRSGVVEVIDLFEAETPAEAQAWVEARATKEAESVLNHYRSFGGPELWGKLGLLVVRLTAILKEGNAYVCAPPPED